jgi:hypothetical protein
MTSDFLKGKAFYSLQALCVLCVLYFVFIHSFIVKMALHSFSSAWFLDAKLLVVSILQGQKMIAQCPHQIIEGPAWGNNKQTTILSK